MPESTVEEALSAAGFKQSAGAPAYPVGKAGEARWLEELHDHVRAYTVDVKRLADSTAVQAVEAGESAAKVRFEKELSAQVAHYTKLIGRFGWTRS